jgi:hypothetical protein
MNIDRTNYEVFFLDFFEGSLSDEQCQRLIAFLEENPDLKHEFDLFDFVGLDAADLPIFKNKESLKKTEEIQLNVISLQNYNDFFIAWHEGDLTDQQKIETQMFVEENPSLKQDFEVFAKMKFEAEAHVTYAHKNLLKRKTTMLAFHRYISVASSVAAVFLIAFFAFNAFQLSNDTIYMTAAANVERNLPEYSERVQEIQIQNENLQFENGFSKMPDVSEYRKPEGQTPSKMQTSSFSSIPQSSTNYAFAETKRSEYYDIYRIKEERSKLYSEEYGADEMENVRLFDKVIAMVRSNSSEIDSRIDNVDGWQLAHYGVKGFNAITNNDVEFNVKKNNDGKVNKVSFNNFGIPVRRNR